MIPLAVVSAPLVVIGAMTVGMAREVDWDDVETAVPALLTMASMPLMFSIADGLAMGTICFALLKVLRGRKVHWAVLALAAVFAARFALLA